MTRHASAWGLLLAVLLLSAMLYAAPLNFAEAYLWTAQTLMGETGQTAVWMLATAALLPVGALLGALPERIRRRKSGAKTTRSSWRAYALAFAGGFATIMGAIMAGGGVTFHLFGGIAAGALSSWAVVVILLIGGCLTARVGRKEASS